MDRATKELVERTTGREPWWPSVVPSSRRVRVELGGSVVAESLSPLLVLQYGRPPCLPTYYFPPEEVDETCLTGETEQEDGSTSWDVEKGGRRADSAAWTHPDPIGDLAPLSQRITFDWWGDLRWFEEEEEVFAHARDPFKRVDVLSSSRHIQVYIDGEKVADSRRPTMLFETYLPDRYYLPREDVRLETLDVSDTSTMCPYKGKARHWSAGGTDVAWSYEDPVPENPRIKDLVSFYNERVDLIVDGVLQDRPKSPWDQE